jgi:glycosyltransferase involved in cell wall biosynthesis
MRSSHRGGMPGWRWAINGRFLTQRLTGVQRYAFEIATAMDQLISEPGGVAERLEMQLIVPPKAKTRMALSSIETRGTRYGSGHIWDQFVLPFYAKAGVLSLGNFGPVLARNHIVCIHDANTFIEPESYSRPFRLAYRTLLPLIGRRASRVATVSQFSADMIVKFGICNRQKIFVAPNGHEHALRWNPSDVRTPLVGTLVRPYVMLLGSTAKHKNVEIILRQAGALDRAGIDIVVVGGGANIFSTKAEIIQHSNIHYAGYVEDSNLAALYLGAICLVFPSKTEGFGLPPLEAMTWDCPVICSKVASLEEVCGDAAMYVGADHSEGWRDAIIGLSGNAELRAAMVARGKKRVSLFSWKRSAQIYIDELTRGPETARS